jgi:hypothetical protein
MTRTRAWALWVCLSAAAPAIPAVAAPRSNRAPAGRTSCGAVRQDCVRSCRAYSGHSDIEREKTTECVKVCAEQYDRCVANRTQ